MILECFRNYIGLRGCGTTAPPSGLFINSLEGINEMMMTNAADKEQKTAEALYSDAQDNALSVLHSDILGTLNDRFRQETIAENVTFGVLDEPLENVALGNELRGVVVELDYNLYFELNLFQIHLYTVAAVTDAVITIYDLVTGQPIRTITQDLAIGNNVITIEQAFPAIPHRNRLFISYDASIVQSVESKNRFWNDACDCVGLTWTGGGKVAKGTPVLWDNLARDGETHGMSLCFSLQCSMEKFICSIRSQFASPLKYLLGREIVAQLLHTNRWNEFTTVQRQPYQELHDEFERKYKDQLETTLRNIKLPDDRCFECDPEYHTVYIDPN